MSGRLNLGGLGVWAFEFSRFRGVWASESGRFGSLGV